jgi:hypothetical protein
MRLEAMALTIPHVQDHPNRVPFEGVLTVVNTASDKAPSGARGHRVMLTREAVENALPSLVTEADLKGKKLVVKGYLYARDFPDAAKAIQAHALEALGMSYEIADARVEDMRAGIWKLTRIMFTGAAILLREKAAYKETSFRMAS